VYGDVIKLVERGKAVAVELVVEAFGVGCGPEL